MDLQFKSIPFEIKAASEDGSWFEGKASPFWNIDSYQEIVDDKAFDQDLPEFLARGFIGGINHDWDQPIGRPMEGTMPMQDHMHIKGSVVDTSHGMDMRKLLKAGVVQNLSIGYRTMGDRMLENADECMAYWREKGYMPNAEDMQRCQAGARVLTRIKLFEVSPVTVPANSLAAITAVKARALSSMLEIADRAAVSDEEPADQRSEPRLDRIRSITSLADAEAVLRDADFTGTERKAFISIISELKSPPRDVAGGDAGQQPETTAEPEPDASATPAEEGQKADDSEAPTPTPALEGITLDFYEAAPAISEDDEQFLAQLHTRNMAAVLEAGRTFAGV